MPAKSAGRRPRQHGRTRHRGLAASAVPALALLLAGCGGSQSSLAPKSHQARTLASLWWWMLGGACIGFAVVVLLLALTWTRRNRRGIGGDTEGLEPGERFSMRVVLGLGLGVPIAVLVALFVISDIFVIRTTQAPAAAKTALTVQVVGHQWWWEVRYPGTKAVTANEIHVPVRTPVLVQVTTADVIHSFWVPELNRKIDTIPGRVNSIELEADQPGRYRGQCAEYCGLQHAHMALDVVADAAPRFRTWLANQAKPAPTPATGLERSGQQAFLSGSCSSCHAIRGTAAASDVGPDLTHLATRATLAAVTLPNTPQALATWITETQHVKPGNQMPDAQVAPDRLHALVAYLESLR
jgi:cytochrome c oxidase subunit 2